MKKRKLVIISHTAHYAHKDKIVGWGPTVREINFLADFWDEVVHIGCIYSDNAPKSSEPYSRKNIHFVPISPTGGEKLLDKFGVVWKAPSTIVTVVDAIKDASHVQLRVPTGIAVYLLPAFSGRFWKRNFVFWVKYAGNWSDPAPPLGYRIQRWWLRNNLADCKVTVNGRWSDQPEHCISFENPCLRLDDLEEGRKFQRIKHFEAPFRFAFVGRLEDAKGVSLIIDSFKNLDVSTLERIDFIGDGPMRHHYEQRSGFLGSKAVFHGFLHRKEVHEILSKAHFLVLPSASEGFPKVIAEAACYGCIPIVSDVGSISHYVSDDLNSFLWNPQHDVPFSKVINGALSETSGKLLQKSKAVMAVAEEFTFENYRRKLEAAVFS